MMKAKGLVAQSCPTLCDPVDCSLPGFSVHGILQATMLEWIAISSSMGSSSPRDRTRVLLHCRQEILYHLSHRAAQQNDTGGTNTLVPQTLQPGRVSGCCFPQRSRQLWDSSRTRPLQKARELQTHCSVFLFFLSVLFLVLA